MNTSDDIWLCLLLVALLGSLLYLRSRFPKISRVRETTVLLVATILFFSICGFFRGAQGTVLP